MDDVLAAYIGHRGVDLCLKEEDAGAGSRLISPRLTRKRKLFLVFLLLLAAFFVDADTPQPRYFRMLTGQMAFSDAEDV
jgi:hypothetical protein